EQCSQILTEFHRCMLATGPPRGGGVDVARGQPVVAYWWSFDFVGIRAGGLRGGGGMTLQQIIEQAVAHAFAAGAVWYAIVRARQDSASVGREARTWKQDERYQLTIKRHQRAATEAVGRTLMRLILTEEQQDRHKTLF